MTEDEAKTKWCPQARVFLAGDYWQSTNGADLATMTAHDLRPLTRCIGSACMTWRKLPQSCSRCGGDGFIESVGMCYAEICPMWADKKNPLALDKAGRGYCGLAGKP